MCPHPNSCEKPYNFQNLRLAIEKILKTATGDHEKTEILMERLRNQVNEGLDSISIFRNYHENDREYIHCYCLATAFYLDHF